MAIQILSAEATAAVAMGTPTFLGVVVATTTKNNHDTAVPFNNTGDALKGKVLLIQTDAAVHIYFGTTNAITATTANGVKLTADQRVIVKMTQDHGWIAAVGAASVRVWELT